MIKTRKPNIVVIGGGTGLPVILNNLKKLNADLTAVVTVADDGGSSGRIRAAFNSVPPGDIRNVLVSLSDIPQIQKDIFQYRFHSKDKMFDGHAIGNLIIQALSEMEGSISEAIKILADMMKVEGNIYPASEEPLTLHARYRDGSVASGESHIPVSGKVIDYVAVSCLNDRHKPIPCGTNVVSAIMEADVIVLGPGSLYTSILPSLMIPDIGKAVLETDARVVYICNIMTQLGETEGFTDADHVRVLHRHLNSPFIDTALINNKKVPFEYVAKEKSEYLFQVTHDFHELSKLVPQIISDDFLKLTDKGVYHNGEKAANEIYNIANTERNKIAF
ncbi:MAG TPA: uridine diphosphate-N-acetylglucosamine-binding protein YvcK [Alloiococcus sp.]|nr:uridine diphosphate-N-acetylglucosamine-binding protein YvcK [Alloiococcus sp.]